MHHVLLTLILADAALLAYTAAVGLTLDGREAMGQHYILGLSAAMLTCFIHVLVMFYLIGTGKDIRDAVEDIPELDEKFRPLTSDLKRRVFPPACLSVALIIFATLMGGEVHSRLIAQFSRIGELPFRGVTAWWLHGAIVLVALVVNAWGFYAELSVAKANRAAIEEINRYTPEPGRST